jgi:hypothetical protein
MDHLKLIHVQQAKTTYAYMQLPEDSHMSGPYI